MKQAESTQNPMKRLSFDKSESHLYTFTLVQIYYQTLRLSSFLVQH